MQNRRKTIENSDLNLVSIFDWFLIVFWGSGPWFRIGNSYMILKFAGLEIWSKIVSKISEKSSQNRSRNYEKWCWKLGVVFCRAGRVENGGLGAGWGRPRVWAQGSRSNSGAQISVDGKRRLEPQGVPSSEAIITKNYLPPWSLDSDGWRKAAISVSSRKELQFLAEL